jgi:hypothetical protein
VPVGPHAQEQEVGPQGELDPVPAADIVQVGALGGDPMDLFGGHAQIV